MFHNISLPIRAQMVRLEENDARDRVDSTLRLQRLRQFPPETGNLLAILVANTPKGEVVEIGASGNDPSSTAR